MTIVGCASAALLTTATTVRPRMVREGKMALLARALYFMVPPVIRSHAELVEVPALHRGHDRADAGSVSKLLHEGLPVKLVARVRLPSAPSQGPVSRHPRLAPR